MDIKQIINQIKTKMDTVGGLKSVIYVACGGSNAAIYPSKYMLERETKAIGTSLFNSSEFVSLPPKSLDERCICIICSMKATAETVEAVKVANAKGAVTISMTGFPDSAMAQNGQYTIVYSHGDNQIYSQGNQAMALKLGFEILYQFENYPHYQEAMAAYCHIDKIIADSKINMKTAAEKFGNDFKHDEIFYVLANGPLLGTAYTMACCHLQEMQCRHAVTMHSGEYFHGPFETTDEKLAMILLMCTGSTRVLDERALTFMKKYARHFIVIDAKNTGIEVIDAKVAEYFNSVIMIPIERFFVSVMANVRGVSMEDRRYMWKVEY